jgi:hypothetical protein
VRPRRGAAQQLLHDVFALGDKRIDVGINRHGKEPAMCLDQAECEGCLALKLNQA